MIELIYTSLIDVFNQFSSINWSSFILQLNTEYSIFYKFNEIPFSDAIQFFIQAEGGTGVYFDKDGYIVDGGIRRHWTSYIPSMLISGAVLALIFFVVFKVFKEALGFGTFSRFFKLTLDNKRYAYKVIGCHLVLAERGNEREQFKYLITYLRNRFPELGIVDTSELHRLAYLYKDITEPLKWLNEKLPKSEKIRVIDFMVDLAFFNGRLNRREMKLIYLAGEVLEVPRHEIRSILGIRQNHYRQKEARERAQRQQQRKSSTSRARKSTSKKHASLKVLGLPNTIISFQEVRKAYRALARKHHPDRYMQASEAEQKMAHERFTQINLAYEYLEEVMK